MTTPTPQADPVKLAEEILPVLCDEVGLHVAARLAKAVADKILSALRRHAEKTLVAEGWQPIETAPKDGRDVLLWWQTCARPVIGHWTYDDCWETRPKGWRGSREGWLSDGDQCIARNQSDCILWMPVPANPGRARCVSGDEFTRARRRYA